MGKVRLAGKVAGWIEFRQFIKLATCSDRTGNCLTQLTGGLGARAIQARPDQLDPYLPTLCG